MGLYPFAISIILFSLIIDRIGYGTAMAFAFVGHLASTLLTIFAPNFAVLYIATFIYALANGTVEAVINPVVATVYKDNKTHWLNILHAGWPGGHGAGRLLAIGVSKVGHELGDSAAGQIVAMADGDPASCRSSSTAAPAVGLRFPSARTRRGRRFVPRDAVASSAGAAPTSFRSC